jgi:hypothetical protein
MKRKTHIEGVCEQGGPKREEHMGGWRIFQNKESHILSASQNTIKFIKLRRMIGESCRTYGRNEKTIQGFGRET